MARKYRRVTKAEDAEAWRKRRYTLAGAGKFRKSSKTISFRQYIQKQAGGVTIEKQIKERKQTRSNIAAHKARMTRSRNKELREYMHEAAKMAPGDAALVNKYIESGYRNFTPAERERFNHLFVRYPADLVRGWLGSDEKSRAKRRLWDMHVSASGLAA